ncbi:MAG TPA: hypothetical protein VM734_34820 [Kofleriaceae bacterium]|jgi:hypothetical protein|nr:hypothetical protein [Kofleriaceae bacterium]
MDHDGRSPLARLELVLLVVAAAEVGLGRVLTRGLEKTPVFVHGVPQKVVPPTWFVALDYVALFLLYFAALLGVIVLAVRAAELVRGVDRGPPAQRLDRAIGAATTGVLALSAVFAAVVAPGPAQVPLHAALALVAVHQVVRVWLRRDELGAAVGITLCALPIIIYCAASLFSDQLWNEDQLHGGEARAGLGRWGRAALAVAAIASPYCLAPRPLARTMTRIVPFAVALAIAGLGAALLRTNYLATVKAANRAFGLDLRTDAPQDQLALYLLAFSTLTWTITACLTAPSAARRRIGVGLALLMLAGWAFAWPLAFVVAGAGLALIGDGAMAVRREERSVYAPVTPAIDDDVWQGYVGHVVSGLRRLAGDDTLVSAVSVRGEGDHTSSVIVTERHGVPVRVRVERVARAVVVVDVVCGREVDASRGATWSIVGRATGVLGGGGHPEPPPAGSLIRTQDHMFDETFRCRGDHDALLRLLDADLRARAAAGLDGWLAYWGEQSLRHRVFPGQGAPVDRPIPLADLAASRRATAASAEALIAVIELCAEIARRGLPAEDEPAALAAAPIEPVGEGAS